MRRVWHSPNVSLSFYACIKLTNLFFRLRLCSELANMNDIESPSPSRTKMYRCEIAEQCSTHRTSNCVGLSDIYAFCCSGRHGDAHVHHSTVEINRFDTIYSRYINMNKRGKKNPLCRMRCKFEFNEHTFFSIFNSYYFRMGFLVKAAEHVLLCVCSLFSFISDKLIEFSIAHEIDRYLHVSTDWNLHQAFISNQYLTSSYTIFDVIWKWNHPMIRLSLPISNII